MGDVPERYTITKAVAKHGKTGIIAIPKILNDSLPPGTVVRLDIEVLKRGDACE